MTPTVAAISQPESLGLPAHAAAVACTAPPDPRRQPGNVVSAAAASPPAQSAAPDTKELAAKLDKLQPEDIKQLLIQVQTAASVM
jgi:hypothetical protein